MSKILVAMVLVGLLLGAALPVMADNSAAPAAREIDLCASPYLWLYKASEGRIGEWWYGPVARAFNHFAETGDDFALSCVVRWMGLEAFWPEYRIYCVRYIKSSTFEYMAEPVTYPFVAWLKR
jgi:uncharacterized low-complexity protein